MSTVMIRRDFDLQFPPDRRYSEDYYQWLAAAYSGGRLFVSAAPLAMSYKADFGDSGVSSRLWLMERGELRNIADLRTHGHISYVKQVIASAWSLLRFARRVVVSSYQ